MAFGNFLVTKHKPTLLTAVRLFHAVEGTAYFLLYSVQPTSCLLRRDAIWRCIKQSLGGGGPLTLLGPISQNHSHCTHFDLITCKNHCPKYSASPVSSKVKASYSACALLSWLIGSFSPIGQITNHLYRPGCLLSGLVYR